MLDINLIREKKDFVIERLQTKHLKDAALFVEKALSVDENRRKTQLELDNLLAQSNQITKEIGLLMKEGKKDEAEKAKSLTAELKEKSKSLSDALRGFEEELQAVLYKLPNLPHESVPQGRAAEDNIIVFEKGTKPNLYPGAKPHWELIQQYDIVDFELGNKITGAGFPVYKGKGAKIQRALISFFLDEAEKAGYNEVLPPIFINEASGYGTGQLPDKDGQMYYMERDGLYAIPTAEVPITNMYRDEIIRKEDLPIKNAGFTPCFRREAGSWGSDVRGLNRLHQFDKVEIVQIAHPNESYKILEEMCAHVEGLLDKLELPYRKLRLCGGDMSFTSALTYDYEVFSAAQNRWLEVSSVSNFETYQARRLKLRFNDENNKKQVAHTLNGSALALPRILAALLENNQTEQGINIPVVLKKYLNFDKI